jgi:hypothetical protein
MKVDAIEVAILKIHAVDIIAPGTMNDPADLCPNACHRARPAWLQCRVERRAAQFHIADVSSRCPKSANFSMSRRVVVFTPEECAAYLANSGYAQPNLIALYQAAGITFKRRLV